MCQIIIINKGEKEIESPREFEQHFKFEAPVHTAYMAVGFELNRDACLCQVDIEKAFTDNGIAFTKDGGNYLVEQ